MIPFFLNIINKLTKVTIATTTTIKRDVFVCENIGRKNHRHRL